MIKASIAIKRIRGAKVLARVSIAPINYVATLLELRGKQSPALIELIFHEASRRIRGFYPGGELFFVSGKPRMFLERLQQCQSQGR